MSTTGTNHSSDSAIAVYWGFLFVAGWLAWHFFLRTLMTALMREVRYGELWLIARFVSDPVVPQVAGFLKDKRYNIDWPYIKEVSVLTGHYMRYPVALFLFVLSVMLIFLSPKSSFKKAYSLDRLIEAQSKMWPVIAPIVKFNAAEDNARDPNAQMTEDDLPVFAEAMSPEEWLTFNGIAHGPDGLDRDTAAQCFVEQLGARWRGADALPWHDKALFAVFALKSARQREEADDLLGRIAMSVDGKNGMSFNPTSALRNEIQKIIRNPKLGGEAEKIAQKHAYVAPAMMRLLAYSRFRGGVLAPAQFLWLRGAHRALWYPLNNLGPADEIGRPSRLAVHVEAAGAIAHYQAEIAAGTPLLSPKVMAAVDSLNEYDHRKSRFLPGIAE